MCDPCDEISGITIPAGDDGIDGLYGGFSSEWLFETNTGSGPGSTFIRLNNTTYSSVTNIYINETNANSTNLGAFLNSFNNGGGFGHIRLFREDNSNVFFLGTITAVTDNGSDYTIAVTYIAHNGTFAASDNVIVTFNGKGTNGAAGSAGAAGVDGDDGTSLLYNGTTQGSTNNTSPTYVALDSAGIIPINQLATNGDKVKIIHNFTKSIPVADQIFQVKLVLSNNSIAQNLYEITIPSRIISGKIVTEITRLTSTTAIVQVESHYVNQMNTLINGFGSFNRTTTIVFSLACGLSAQYYTDSTDTITHEQLCVEFYNI